MMDFGAMIYLMAKESSIKYFRMIGNMKVSFIKVYSTGRVKSDSMDILFILESLEII